MADNAKQVTRFHSDDLRRCETHVEESSSGVQTERVTTHLEEKVPLEVRKVVAETIVPVVVQRKTQEFQDGQVVSEVVESVPEHATALSEAAPAALPDKDVIKQAIREVLAEGGAPRSPAKVAAPVILQEPPVPGPAVAGGNDFRDTVLYSLLAFLAAAGTYMLFLKNLIS